MKTIAPIFASIFSGVLVSLSFPRFDLHILAWIALVPLFLTLLSSSPGYGFFLSFVCGIVFFPAIFNWILEVPRYTFLHHAILGIYLGCYLGLFGLMFAFVCRRSGMLTALFVAPFAWVSVEYIRSSLSFLSLPWGLLAHSQYQYPTIIQIASVTGAYGISFLIVMVNGALAAVVYPLLGRFRRHSAAAPEPPSAWERTALMVTAATLTVITLLYGYVTISKPLIGKAIKLCVVQGNIEQAKKWDPRYAKYIMKTYADLTREASKSHPTLIIWPETATPRAINRDFYLYREVRRIARRAGTYLLLGSAQLRKFKRRGSDEAKYWNSAFLISPEPGMAKNQKYDKIHLLPFAEYLPLKGIIPWSYINVSDISGYAPGNEFTIFELSPFRFGVTICWENIFPDLFRQFVKRGAQFMVNLTNEAWFGETAAPYQFLSMSVLRAVENRVYVVRCVNTGISCFIDPCGRIVDRVKDEKGQDLFVAGVLSRTVIPMESNTIYTRYGDWFVWLSLACSAGFLLVAFLRKKPEPRSIATRESHADG